VTIECGGARDPRSDEVALTGLTRYLCVPTLIGAQSPGSTVGVLRHPIRVRLADGATIAYGSEPVAGAALTLRRDIDRYNSSVLPASDPIGWTSSLGGLTAINGSGVELRDELLAVRGGRLYARRPLRLFMATTDARIAAGDCLFYAVIAEDRGHAG
jgi:hypothetical protein